MKYFLLPSQPNEEGFCRVEGQGFRHLVKSRRLRAGQSLVVLVPGEGRTRRAQVQSLGKDHVVLALSGAGPSGEPILSGTMLEGPEIILCPSLIKGNNLDNVVRQATEMGVAQIRPLITERTVVKPAGEQGAGGTRVQRWEKIVREAGQQSGSTQATRIFPALDLESLPGQLEPGTDLFFCHEHPLDKGAFHGYLSGTIERLALLIGPEGGFSPRETEFLIQWGARPLYFGPRVFKADTAAIFAISAVRIILQEKESWHIPS